MKFTLPHLRLTPLIALLGAPAAIAQTTTAPRPEAIVLTPFEVSSASDNGYAATETLAGTRLRTNLRDIGASLSILTPEFMRDLGRQFLRPGAPLHPERRCQRGRQHR
jgi:outer membrane receptor for ferric coprogen and ferric-rhodotorulic acid